MVIILLGNRKCPGEQIFIYDTCNILCDKNKGDNKRYHITVYRTHIHTPAYITVYRTYIHTPAHTILNQFQHLNSKEKMEILTNKLNE